MAEEAKNRRRNAKTKFTRKKNELIKAINEEKTLDVVRRIFMDFSEAWANVEAKHDHYSTFLNDEDSLKEEPWIEELQQQFTEVLERQSFYEREIKQRESLSKMQEEQRDEEDKQSSKSKKMVEKARTKREVKEAIFMQILDDLGTLFTKADDDVDVKGISSKTTKELKIALDECKEANDKYIELIEQEDVKVEIAWMKRIQKIYNVSTDEIERRIAKHQKQESSNIRMEKIKLPTFDGNLRNYPRFKTDFQKQVMPSLSKDAAPYTLRSCLSKEPLSVVKSVDDDIDQMWERLDEKYADPAKITDVIINAIQNFKFIKENESKKFVEFVNTIEESHRDLLSLGMEKEITTTSFVSVIEKKLPPDMRKEWSKLVTDMNSKVDKKDKFPSLLEFLINHKKAIEYDAADLRMIASSRSIVQTHCTTGKENNEYQACLVQPNKPDNTKTHRKCLIHNNADHWTDECKVYLSKSFKEKMELLKEKKACWSCLKSGHQSRDCKRKRNCGENGCTLSHHKTLHDHKKQELGVSICKEPSNACLLQCQSIETPKGKVNVLWDNAASLCFITFNKAKDQNLTGKEVELSIVTVGGKVEQLSSKKYVLPLIDKEGKTVNIDVYGIEKITSDIDSVAIDDVVHLFKVTKEEITRPSGPVDVLIGYSYAGIHPQVEQKSEHLLLLKNQFGKCLGGSHPKLTDSDVKINHACAYAVSASPVSIEDFYKIENLGVGCSPRCGSCKCGKCSPGTKNCTLQEERELKLIEENLSYDCQDNVWTANYPWIKDPTNLPDNKVVATKMLESTERRLLKNPVHAKVYQEQIQDMVNRNVARKLTTVDLNVYDGPVHYIAHHEVLRPDSKSTPVRIVFNSSASYMGHVLNNYWAKGPDLLNSLLGVLVRFRENEVAILGDIKKMYHSVKIGLVDQHTQSFSVERSRDR